MKRLLCMCLALVLVLSILPGTVLATGTGSGCMEGTVQQTVQSSLASGSSFLPALKEGHYQKWFDRLADLPEYARSFYLWLVENANPQGALVNPQLGTQNGQNFLHPVITDYTQTVALPADLSNYKTVASQAASAGARELFGEASAYLKAVYDTFDRDHPEVFWLNGVSMYGYNCSYNYSFSGSTVTVKYNVSVYFFLQSDGFDIRKESYRNAGDIARDIALRDQTVDKILANCPTTGTEDQLRYLNRVLVERNAYNSAVAAGNTGAAHESAWECLNALVGSVGLLGPVCEGYSRAFQVLCNELGIPCVLVDGPAKSKKNEATEAHMWNYVQLEGQWYAVDITWNDPYNSSNPLAKLSGYECEKWMLLGSDTEVAPQLTFIESHKVENSANEDGLKYTNGPALSKDAYTPGQTGSGISVCVENPGDANSAITLSLYIHGTTTPLAEKTFTGAQVEHTFGNLSQGSYLLVISKEGYATRDYIVSTADDATALPTLTLLGDISPDGQLNVGDVSKLYSFVQGHCLITDSYHLRVADMNGDGVVDIGDVGCAYAQIRK